MEALLDVAVRAGGVGVLEEVADEEGLYIGPSDLQQQGEVWAAAGLVDTDLSFLSLLELYGTEISERRMPTRRVVEALDVVEHI